MKRVSLFAFLISLYLHSVLRKSKYLIAIAVFAGWMFFFDDRDIITTHFRHPQELKDLNLSKKYYEDQISETRAELDQLRKSNTTMEKYAREKYFMKRDNEDLFVVQEPKAE